MRRPRRSPRSLALAALLAASAASAGGRPATVATPLEAPAPAARAGRPRVSARLVFVALDAVPYGVVAELTDPARGERALFQAFARPSALISSFPSTTTPAMSGLLAPLGLERAPGYEARFFDWHERRVRGGGPISYFRIDFPWRSFFDWDKKGPFASMVSALRPVKASITGLRHALEAFLHSPRQTFLIYIGDTDIAAHLKSPESLGVVLSELDGLLAQVRTEHPEEPFHAVVFSDHGIAGGQPLANAWKPVRQALKAAGFRLRKRLENPEVVTVAPYGLVSSFQLFTWPGREEEAAAAAVGASGVDLCAYPSEEGWRVIGQHGTARIERRSHALGTQWRYVPESGDPLRYSVIARELAREPAAGGSASGGAWVEDARWFAATAGADYPDALHRIARSFDLVDNPASVVCSMAPGHMFGARRTELGARISTEGGLAWTHGALDADASLGFMLTDVPGWQGGPVLRFDEALAAFARPADGPPPMIALADDPDGLH